MGFAPDLSNIKSIQTLRFVELPMSVAEQIEKKLSAQLEPVSLEIVDESHLHEGHSGHRPGGETHFRVRIVAKIFEGKSLVERHRMVNEVLADELAGPIHALAITASPPEV